MRISSIITVCTTTLAHAAIVLPQGAGPYATSLLIEEWVDSARPDPFNTSHPRRIMISRFDPVPRDECSFETVPYMTPATAAVEDSILAEFDYPTGLWQQLELEVCIPKATPKLRARNEHNYKPTKGSKFPLAFFSPGLNTTRLFSNLLVQEIASHGFTVISLDHPYDTDVVEFPNGDVILGGHVQKPANGSTASVDHALDVRAQDVSFALDHLGIPRDTAHKVAMFGHSFGGAASATAMLNDTRIRAGINIDGTMFGPVVNSSLGTPARPQAFMLWGSDGHSSFTDPSWGDFWRSLNGSAYVDYKREFTIVNSTHGSCWDLNLLVDVLGLREGLTPTARLLVGPVPGTRIWKIMGRYVSAFLGFLVGGEEEDGVLRGENGGFEEVVLLRE